MAPVENQNYHFQATHDDQSTTGAIAGLQIPSLDKMLRLGAKYGEYMAAFRGSLLQLFGKPFVSSEFADEAYTYVIQATDAQSRSWVLLVIQGSSGPSILGDPQDGSVYAVAEALLLLIEQTPPADFAAVIYSEDTDTTITYGCQAGSCYWREVSGKHTNP